MQATRTRCSTSPPDCARTAGSSRRTPSPRTVKTWPCCGSSSGTACHATSRTCSCRTSRNTSPCWTSCRRPCRRHCEKDSTTSEWRRLWDVQPGRGAGDHEPLDLGCALEERVDLRVAVPLLDREVPDVAVAAEHLDSLLGDPARDLTRLELAHRALAVLEPLLRRAHPRRPPHEQACGVDLHLHVGELERDALVLDDLATERLALLCVVERELVGGPGDAECLRADDRSRRLERAHRRLHLRALALTRPGETRFELLRAAEQARARDANLVEQHLARVRGADAHLLLLLPAREPGCARRDDEGGVAS